MRQFAAVIVIGVLIQLSCAVRQDTKAPTQEKIDRAISDGERLVRTGQYEAAQKLLRPLAEKRVGRHEIHRILAEALWKTGANDEAVRHFEDALRLNYPDYLTHLRFAEMLLETGKVGRALTEFELAANFGAREPVAHYNYGLALYRLGRKRDALVQWQAAYTLEKTNPRYAEAVGMGYAESDDDQALVYFERAADLGADSKTFHNNFGLLLQRLKKYFRAERQFKEAIRKDPEDQSVIFNLAALYMSMKEFRAAIPLWESLIESTGNTWDYPVHLARALLETGRFSEGIAVLEPAASRRESFGGAGGQSKGEEAGAGPGLDEAFDILALCYRGTGNLAKAATNMEKALAIQPENVTRLNNYGVILAESGKIVEARNQWEKVLNLDPGNELARRNLETFSK